MLIISVSFNPDFWFKRADLVSWLLNDISGLLIAKVGCQKSFLNINALCELSLRIIGFSLILSGPELCFYSLVKTSS